MPLSNEGAGTPERPGPQLEQHATTHTATDDGMVVVYPAIPGPRRPDTPWPDPVAEAEAALAGAADQHVAILEFLFSALENVCRGNYVVALCDSYKATARLAEAVEQSDFDMELEAEYEH